MIAMMSMTTTRMAMARSGDGNMLPVAPNSLLKNECCGLRADTPTAKRILMKMDASQAIIQLLLLLN
jgi:hypothetical protein